MKNKLEKKLLVLPSQCDETARLRVPALFEIFMDLASEHAPMMGMGAPALAERGLFWLTVKTRVRVHARPEMLTQMHAETWPEKPGRLRCNRYYRLTNEQGLLAEGKTEWAILHVESGRVMPTAQVYERSLEHLEETLLEEPFTRIREDFSDAEVLERYRVRSTDIDLGQHMNNAAYPRALFGAISTAEWKERPVREMDVIFRSPSYEGEVLTICRRNTPDGMELAMLHEDGRAAAVARVRY